MFGKKQPNPSVKRDCGTGVASSVFPSRWESLHFRLKLNDPRSNTHGIKGTVIFMRAVSLLLTPILLAGFAVLVWGA